MNKGGMGVGSASIVLVFAVLCLTIFALITFTSAQNDMALVQAEKQLVTGYYLADTRAEYIVYGLSVGGEVDVEINREWDDDIGANVASFSCPISDKQELYVQVALYEHDYDILSWRMRGTGAWEADDSILVWPGMEIDDGAPMLMNSNSPLWSSD